VEGYRATNLEATMTRGLIFWVIMLIWLVLMLAVFGGFVGRYGGEASNLLLFILFLLLGWQVYGPPVRG
jgi:hypothetical protein